MTERRVALLRALNVGGTGLLKMERLRQVAGSLGWKDVTTVGASGNVLYTAGRASAKGDAARLAEALSPDLGRIPTVIIRSQAEMQAIVDAQPFAGVDPTIPPKWWFVGMLAQPKDGDLPAIVGGAPLLYARRLADAICWTMSEPDRRAIDHPKRIEKTLGIPMTVRNWNVVNDITTRLAG